MKNKQNKPVRVIAVTSGKGGIGKTSVSLNLSAALSRVGQKVMLFDADLGLANVDVLLGLHPKRNLSHVVSGQCSLSDVILDGPAGIKIIPASSGVSKMADMGPVEHAGIIQCFSTIEDPIDTMIVDTAAGVASGVTSYARAAQDVVVVVCDEPASITDAYAMIKVLNRDHKVRRFHILSNMVSSMTHGRELFEKIQMVTSHYLNVSLNYLGSIPMDDSIRKSAQSQKLLLDCFPSSSAANAFNDLAKSISRWGPPSDASGGLTFFLERLINAQRSPGLRVVK